MKRLVPVDYYDLDGFNSCFSHVQTFSNDSATGLYTELRPSLGTGYLWLYEKPGIMTICNRDFAFYDDVFIEASRPKTLAVTYFESISGEEFDPYRGLNSGTVKIKGHDDYVYRALIHKGVPVLSSYVEIYPKFFEECLYSHGFKNIPDLADISFRGESSEFLLITQMLKELASFKGTFEDANIYYEKKVTEVCLQVVTEYMYRSEQRFINLSSEDERHLESVIAYLNDHYYFDIPLDCLAHIAGMGTTKLKSAFKQMTGCTITEYVHQKRMRYAAHLLAHTDFPIAQIAEMVGYTTPSRFAELFKRNTGSLPLEYRKLSQGK